VVRKAFAAAGSIVFFFLAPGVVAGLIPRWLTNWQVRSSWPYAGALRVVGAVILVVCVSVLVHSFVRFVAEGIGTPAPVAPTKHLVVGGLYRFVRNPMYLAIDGIVFGQALVLGQSSLVWYGVLITLIQTGFVYVYEEQALLSQFGEEYEEYRRHVPAWLPRLTPWSPGKTSVRRP
jgi:protein-S-isoprenylcysteine O-methyltransferase Ste14